MESVLAMALEYTLKYWLKSFSSDQFKLQGRTVLLSNIGSALQDSAIHEDIVRAAYDMKAGIRYATLMSKLKKHRVHPDFVIGDAWRRYLEYKESEGFLARPKQSYENRNTEVEGPGTKVSKHVGGSMSFVTAHERLTCASKTTLIVNDLYLHLHKVKLGPRSRVEEEEREEEEEENGEKREERRRKENLDIRKRRWGPATKVSRGDAGPWARSGVGEFLRLGFGEQLTGFILFRQDST
ncbi:hypothetical protein Sjap_020386 [Stephania japonica]|uniref:Uncharacterized protein n=1 Tax=Stephania japonica TaxID=461633 RepID=A0AAP0F3D2_9MAGN